MTLMSVIVAFLFAISLWYLSSNHKVTFVKLKATYLKFLPNRGWHRLIPAGGTFVSATGGTFQSDTPGTFVSAVGGTFDSDIPGTFESATGGTFNPLLSVNQVVRLDKGLLASAEKALAVLFPTKEEKASDTIEEPKPATEDKTTKKIVESSYLDGHQVHEMFGIAYNNIKSKQWRDENNFPYRQPTGEGGRVVYIREEVEEWIKNNGNRG